MQEQTCSAGISGSTLKLIAIVTMFIDHAGATVLRAILNHPDITNDLALRDIWVNIYSMSRSIGRLAFPIFCFLLVEGFTHTRNVRKYAGRLFLFALISEIPFDLALKGNWYFPQKQNVYFTLLAGLLVMIVISFFRHSLGISGRKSTETVMEMNELHGHAPLKSGQKKRTLTVFAHILFVVLTILIILAGMKLADWLDTDYNHKGVFLISVLYLLHDNRICQCAAGAAAVAWELPASLSFVPVCLYNGKRGLRMKYVFYWFYPVHLLLLHAIAEYVIPALHF